MTSPQILTTNPETVATTPTGRDSWQRSVAAAIRSGRALCAALQLPPPSNIDPEADFPVFVPPEFLAKIEPQNPTDPLLRQVLPTAAETAPVAGFTHDPLREADATTTPGILHKYHGRALLVTTNACAVHCRYCFRRHFPYDSIPRGIAAWHEALDAIRDESSIEEVLLSGGDPLMLVDSILRQLIDRLAAIPHVRRVRLHTRLPIMIPGRVTEALVDMLTGTRLTPLVVVHCNHANEFGPDVAAGVQRLIERGIPLLNQSVLLRGVNDDAETLIALSQRLIDNRVFPYYLHQLDRVAGTAHFEVPQAEGQALIAAMRRRLPGYAVPRYVIETPGIEHKEVLQ